MKPTNVKLRAIYAVYDRVEIDFIVEDDTSATAAVVQRLLSIQEARNLIEALQGAVVKAELSEALRS